MSLSVYLASGFFLYTIVYWLLSPSRSKLTLPPGPRKLPIIKNLLEFPLKGQWLVFTRWSKEYKSDIIHAEAGGNSVVILNSLEAMTDLLDKRSAIYSSRAISRVVNEMMGWGWDMAFMPYDNTWKESRRLMVKHFHPSNTSLHRAHERHRLHIFLKYLMNDPKNFLNHARHMSAATTIAMAYGIKVEEAGDLHVHIAETALTNLSNAFHIGTFLVDTFYWLRHLPEGFLGTTWKADVRRLRGEMEDFRDKPYQAALEAIANGTSTDCFITRYQQDLLEDDQAQEDDSIVRDAAGVLLTAGAETPVSVISTFFLASVCFPDAFKKAQAEVDQVLNGRLSEDADMNSLPYLSAFLKEVLRWQPVMPIGMPHAVIQDDEYRGYHIPANSVIIPNIWAIFRDTEIFPDPENFDPERFFKDGKLHVSGPDPSDLTFGFGRRTCLGRHIAESIIFHLAVAVLSLFDVTKALDDDGEPIEPSCEYSPAMTRQPIPFKCSIKPRSQDAVRLIYSLESHGN